MENLVVHLAGKTCVVCREAIRGILDGTFCPSCDSPVHQRCVPAKGASDAVEPCSHCGVDRAALRATAREQRRERVASQRGLSNLEIAGGVLLIGVGIAMAVASQLFLGSTFSIGGGLAVLIRGLQRSRGDDPDMKPPADN